MLGKFVNNLISWWVAIKWPGRSPHFTSRDFLLSCLVKNEVYFERIESLDYLKKRTQQAVSIIGNRYFSKGSEKDE